MKSLDQIQHETPWIPTWHDTGACMDRRHILWLHNILQLTRVNRTLEIGVHTGASASAFVAAGVKDAHFCDIRMTGQAAQVTEGRGVWHIEPGKDVVARERRFDLVFVDGNHALDAVTEEIHALSRNPPGIILAHDVNSTVAGFGACEGAQRLWEWLQEEGWHCLVDAKLRDQEKTHRGMLAATKDPTHWNSLVEAYQQIL